MYTQGAFTSRITNCRFLGNHAHDGGGVFSDTSELRMTNCTFSGNSVSSFGGGMAIVSVGTLSSIDEVTNSTFFGNSSDAGGGIHFFSTPVASFSVRNCILWGNTSSFSSGFKAEKAQINFEGTTFIAVTTSLLRTLNIFYFPAAGNPCEDQLLV